VILIAVIMLSARENNRLDIHRRPIGPRDYGTGDSPDVRQKREEERKKRAAEAKRFIEKARIAFMEGDFRTVVRCAREGTRKAPGLWRGYRLAGLGLLALGSNDSAAFQFNEACRLISDPSESPRLPLLFAAASRLARQKYAHEDFLRLAKRFERDELYDLYEGRISAEEIVASLPPSSRRRGQNPFYAGLYLLGGQDKAKALALLRKGLEFLDKSSQEAVLARALLKRYGGGD
jgi:tetratricopeptide (TPR) repeat protein